MPASHPTPAASGTGAQTFPRPSVTSQGRRGALRGRLTVGRGFTRAIQSPRPRNSSRAGRGSWWGRGIWGQPGLPGAELRAPLPAPQVCLFFQNQLFRGNRVTKVDARRFAAFCSPNLPPLASVGADVTSKRAGPPGGASAPGSCPP